MENQPPGNYRHVDTEYMVSVMIPCCERSTYLNECIESIIAAGLDGVNIEVCVIDNASKNEGIRKIAEKFASNGIKYIRFEERVGMAENWNRCLRHANGKWVHILHDDDLVKEHTYKMLSKSHFLSNAVIICGNADFINKEGVVLGKSDLGIVEDGEPGFNFMARLCGNNLLPVSSVFLRKENMDLMGGFDKDMKYCLDWKYWIICMFQGGVLVCDTLSSYRYYEGNAGKDPMIQIDAPRELIRTAQIGANLLRGKYGVKLSNASTTSAAVSFLKSRILLGLSLCDLKIFLGAFKSAFSVGILLRLLGECIIVPCRCIIRYIRD